jgi:hypothetical protein
MSATPPTDDSRAPERLEYFMLRVRRSADDVEHISGLIERLGTGEKWSFETGQQLLRVVAGDAPRNRGAPVAPPSSQPSEPEQA